MPGPLPFDEKTQNDYAQRFLAACTPTETRRGVLLAGKCPRCDDQMEYELWTGINLGPAAGSSVDWLPMMCTCRETHPGRPSGEEGCGAHWNVTRPSA